jgi:hypothetical protein
MVQKPLRYVDPGNGRRFKDCRAKSEMIAPTLVFCAAAISSAVARMSSSGAHVLP